AACPQRRQHRLEVEEVAHERLDVALEPQRAALDQRHQVVMTGGRNVLPEARPLVGAGSQREVPARHHERTPPAGIDSSSPDLEQVRRAADLEQEGGVDELPAPHQRVVAVDPFGQLLHRISHDALLQTTIGAASGGRSSWIQTTASTAVTPSPALW